MKILKYVFGIVIGAIVGIAFAPKKGSKLREEVMEGFKEGNDKGKKVLLDNAKAIGTDVTKTVKDVFNDPKVQSTLKKAKKDAMKTAGKIKDEVIKQGKELQKKIEKEIKKIK